VQQQISILTDLITKTGLLAKEFTKNFFPMCEFILHNASTSLPKKRKKTHFVVNKCD
jgi:hypothetical protein